MLLRFISSTGSVKSDPSDRIERDFFFVFPYGEERKIRPWNSLAGRQSYVRRGDAAGVGRIAIEVFFPYSKIHAPSVMMNRPILCRILQIYLFSILYYSIRGSSSRSIVVVVAGIAVRTRKEYMLGILPPVHLVDPASQNELGIYLG